MTISMMKKLAALALPLVFTSSSARADSLLRDWNVVVTGDAYAGTETEGPVRIGGNLYVNSTYGVTPRAGTLAGTNGVGLMVGGDVLNAGFQSVKLNDGADVVVGGNGTAGSVFQMNGGGGIALNDAAAQGIGATDAALLAGYSQGFQAMTANNTYTVQGGNTGLFKVTSVDALGNAVFNVNAADVFSNGSIGQLNLDLNGFTFGLNKSIVINVSGSAVSFTGANFLGAFGQAAAANVIWNFYEAATINMNDKNLKGSLLAYNATLTNTNTIDGSVFVKQIGTNLGNGQKAEIHPPYQGLLYQGYVPTAAVPEPSSLALAGVALLAAGAFARRRGGVA